MRKLFTLALLLLSFSAVARHVSPGEASKAAAEFFSKGGQSSVSPKMASALSSDGVEMPYYVFNNAPGQGFVIISGDDRARKILGYSDRGTFNTDNMPPQLFGLLDQFAKKLQSLPASQSAHPSWASATVMSDQDAILLETANWGQGAPYNAKCPTIGDVQAPTGCVATSMAILMKYNKWPESYNWDAMPVSDVTADNSAEIARLMADIGESVFMNYGSDESGAHINWVGHKLQQDFAYSPDCQFISAKNFSTEKWIEMIQDNLNAGHPIIYNGIDESQSSNHAFIIDGYSPDADEYHVNWGWDGNFNGFFAIDALCPGGFDYSRNAGMVINISPDKSGKEYSKCFVDYGYFWATGGKVPGCHVNLDSIEKDAPFDFSCHTLTAIPGFQGLIGVALVDKDDKIKEIIRYDRFSTWSDIDNSYVLMGNSLEFFQMSVKSDIAAGDRLQVVSKENESDDWHIILGTLESPSYLIIDEVVADVAKINVEIKNPDITVNYLNSENQNWDSLTYPGGAFVQLKGSKITIDAMMVEGKESEGIISLSVTGDNLYGDNIFITDSTRPVYAFETYGSEYQIVADLIVVQKENKTINIAEPGDLSNLVAAEEAMSIGNLTLTGEMNAVDFWYIRDNFSNLTRLNLENISVKSCIATDPKFSEFNSSDEQLEDFLPSFALANLTHLKEIFLPVNLKGLANSCMSNTDISVIEIPAGVMSIGLNVFYDSNNLETVICHNPQPVFINACVFGSTKCPDKGVLFVPEGASQAYSETEIWKDFSQIIDNDNPDLSQLSPVIDGLKYNIKGNKAVVIGFDPDLVPQDIVIPSYISAFNTSYPVNEIGESAFAYSEVNSISMDDSIELIGEFCFDSTRAKTIHLSDNIKVLPFCCLSSSFVEVVNLPENLETIATAMPGMLSLKKLYIPRNVHRLSPSSNFGYAFASLKEFEVHPDNEDMCAVDGVLFDKEMKILLNYPGLKEGHYIIPEGVETISCDAFSYSSELTGLTLPSTLTRFETISSCDKLTHLSLPDGVFVSGNAIGLSNLESIGIGDIYYSGSPFYYLNSLSKVYLTGKKSIELESMFNEFNICEIYHSALNPVTSVSKLSALYIPGQSKNNFIDFPTANITEMWSYQIDRKNGIFKLSPEIEGLVIDEILVNGESASSVASDIYSLPSDDNLDIVVSYTLHGVQPMTTHYPAEFNRTIPDVDLAVVTTIELSKSELIMEVGDTEKIVTSIQPAFASDKTVTWSSSNEEIASVDADGNVTALYVGKAVITASCGEISASATLSVNPLKGDANWDGSINIADPVNIVNFVVKDFSKLPNWEPEKWALDDWTREDWNSFFDAGANVNGQGDITIADASAAVDIILAQSPATSSSAVRTASVGDDAFDALVISDALLSVGRQVAIPVALDNSRNYVALQADIHLPEGMSLVSVNVGPRAASHAISSRSFDGGRSARVALFDFNNSAFSDNGEAIMEIVVNVDHLTGEGISLSDIIAADDCAGSHTLSSRMGNVNSGIGGIYGSEVSVKAVAGGLMVSGAEGSLIRVCAVSGNVVRSLVAPSDSEFIALSAGLYIVSVDGTNIKVIVK